MIETKAALRTQLIPIAGDDLILPNTAIAEVIFYRAPEPVAGAPEWLLGRLNWRDRSIALLSFELACGSTRPLPDARAKIVVINTISGNLGINFFAIVTQGLPQLLLVDEGKIAPVAHETQSCPLILSRAIVNGKPAIIPDLDAIESMLLGCNENWARHAALAEA